MNEFLKKLLDFFEIKEVEPEVAKPPAKTEEKPVHTEEPEVGLPAPETSAIEVKEPEPLPTPEIGEEGKRRRIQI